jgi:hypothetical protein
VTAGLLVVAQEANGCRCRSEIRTREGDGGKRQQNIVMGNRISCSEIGSLFYNRRGTIYFLDQAAFAKSLGRYWQKFF